MTRATVVMVALLSLAAPAAAQDKTRVELFDRDSNRRGHATIDEKTGRIDIFDKSSRRTGYGVIQPDGRVDRYRLDGSRTDRARRR